MQIFLCIRRHPVSVENTPSGQLDSEATLVFMSNLIPEVRVNKNGVPVTKHVLPPDASKSTKPLPAPATATVPEGQYQPLPPLKGKDLKDAKEILRLAPNGDQGYEDKITGAYLDNNIRYMRILSTFLDNGERGYPDADFAASIIDTRMVLGLGDDETPEEFAEKCRKYLWMTDGAGPVISEDFDTKYPSEESHKIIKWVEANWDDLDEISEFLSGRQMDDYSAEAFSKLWSDYKGFAAKPLLDGFI